MSHLSLNQLRQANNRRQQEWLGADQASNAFRMIEVAGETSEAIEALLLLTLSAQAKTGGACERMKKWARGALGIAGSTATIEDVAEELADAVIAIDLLASQLGIDLGQAVTGKFDKTSEKYGLETRLGDPEGGAA